MNDFGNSDGPDRVGSPEGDSMACPFDRGLLTAYFDGEVTPAEREEVDRHLASCADCRRDLVDMRSAVTRVKSLPRVKAPPGLAMHVTAALSSSPRAGGSGTGRWFQAAAGIAAALLVAASVMILVRRPSVDEHRIAAASPSAQPPATNLVPRIVSPPVEPGAGKSSSVLDQAETDRPRHLSPAPLPRVDELRKQATEKRARSAEEGALESDEGVKKSDIVPFSEKAKAETAPAPAPQRPEPEAAPAAKADAIDEPRILQVSGKPAAQAIATLSKILQKSKRAASPSSQFGASDFARTHYLEVEVTDAELEDLTKALREVGLAVAPGSLETERRRVAPHDPEATASGAAGSGVKVSPASAPSKRAPEAGRSPAAESKAKPGPQADGPARRVVILAFLDPEPTK